MGETISRLPSLLRDDHADAAELAVRVVLHALEIRRLHELAVRIERAEHPAHRGIREVLVGDFLFVHVVLPDELQRAGENGNRRVGGVILRVRDGERVVAAEADENKRDEKNARGKKKPLFHKLAKPYHTRRKSKPVGREVFAVKLRRVLVLFFADERRAFSFHHGAVDRHVGDVVAARDVIHHVEHDFFQH